MTDRSTDRPTDRSTDEVPIQLILDESAVRAYVDHSGVAVGEALALTMDDGAAFGVHVPTLVTVECTRRPGDMRVHMLTRNAAFRALTVGIADFEEMVHLFAELGAMEPVLAIMSAARYDALLLTADPGAYDGLKEAALRDRVIEIEN